MANKAGPFVIRKFNGDDRYSWAVFRRGDVRGLRGIVMFGQARPVVSGCSRAEARYHAATLGGRDGK
jgi:hypothetical protein